MRNAEAETETETQAVVPSKRLRQAFELIKIKEKLRVEFSVKFWLKNERYFVPALDFLIVLRWILLPGGKVTTWH